MKVVELPCRQDNCGGRRTQTVRYLVIHYTAAPGDTARNNGDYFAREYVGASAHYFVDETTVVRSVPEDCVAWHCGAGAYRHKDCRNANSIGIEICTKQTDGIYHFAPEALALAKELTKDLMERYEIPAENVLRHYDVTGKICPAPFVGQGQGAWEAWKGGLQVYKTLEDVPSWAYETIGKLVRKGLLEGDGTGLNLSEDLTRTLVILDRAGVFTKEEDHGKLE